MKQDIIRLKTFRATTTRFVIVAFPDGQDKPRVWVHDRPGTIREVSGSYQYQISGALYECGHEAISPSVRSHIRYLAQSGFYVHGAYDCISKRENWAKRLMRHAQLPIV